VTRVDAASLGLWREIYLASAVVGDGTGEVVDHFSSEAIANALDDDLAGAAGERYLAYLDGAVVGVASMFVHGEVALFNGAATLPAFRRRGVQNALVATRLADASALGCRFAAITTAPGSRSEGNAFRHGFTIGYGRAILASASVQHRA
jgi:GNAT superfamily N-acetyltransferase